jgi:hypothetical protein
VPAVTTGEQVFGRQRVGEIFRRRLPARRRGDIAIAGLRCPRRLLLTVAEDGRERVQQKAPPAVGQVGLSGGVVVIIVLALLLRTHQGWHFPLLYA